MSNLISLNVNAICKQVEDVLKHFPEVAGAYLFGSALGLCRPDSDIDIGIVMENVKFTNRDLTHLEASMLNEFSSYEGHVYDISIIDLNNPIFSFRIVKEGRLIYVQNFERVTDVIERVSRYYAEVYPRYRRAMEEIIAEVINDGG